MNDPDLFKRRNVILSSRSAFQALTADQLKVEPELRVAIRRGLIARGRLSDVRRLDLMK